MKRFEGIETLPLHIWFAHILPRLSLRLLAQARCVCRSWRDAIFDAAAVPLHSSPEAKRPRLVLQMGDRELVVLMEEEQGPEAASWKVLSLPTQPFLGRLCSVSNGLFCFANQELHQLAVGNPFSQQWKILPSVPSPRPHNDAVALTTCPQTGSYKLLVITASAYVCYASHYDSLCACWTLYQQAMPAPAPRPSSTITLLHGNAYYLSTSRQYSGPSLVAYNLATHSWTIVANFPRAVPRRQHADPVCFEPTQEPPMWKGLHLVRCNDELRVVGRIEWINQLKNNMIVWSYWCLRVDPLHSLVMDFVEPLPRHPSDGYLCCIHKAEDVVIAPSYDDPTHCWLIFNFRTSPTVCYNLISQSAMLKFKAPPGTPLTNFDTLTSGGAFHQPLIWPFSL